MPHAAPHPAQTSPDRGWVAHAMDVIEADFNRSSDTHLLRVPLPAMPGIALYLKDESTHPTGSLKHRLARSLFLYGLCNGWIGPSTTIIEASSGSTAVSEAYFAALLGLRFIAVMPRSTSAEKVAQIAFHGGESHFVDSAGEMYAESARLAAALGGHYMDQFTYAERATDWRGNNNIAESIFAQMAREEHPIPSWIVVGAGTGGTSATLGRYVRYRRLPTRLCIADPESSVFHRHLKDPRDLHGGGAALGRRGHRPAALRAVLPAEPDRPRHRRARCGQPRRGARPLTPRRPLLRRVHRDELLGRDPHRGGDACSGGRAAPSSRCSATPASATAARISTTPGSPGEASTPRPRRRRWSVFLKPERLRAEPGALLSLRRLCGPSLNTPHPEEPCVCAWRLEGRGIPEGSRGRASWTPSSFETHRQEATLLRMRGSECGEATSGWPPQDSPSIIPNSSSRM